MKHDAGDVIARRQVDGRHRPDALPVEDDAVDVRLVARQHRAKGGARVLVDGRLRRPAAAGAIAGVVVAEEAAAEVDGETKIELELLADVDGVRVAVEDRIARRRTAGADVGARDARAALARHGERFDAGEQVTVQPVRDVRVHEEREPFESTVVGVVGDVGVGAGRYESVRGRWRVEGDRGDGLRREAEPAAEDGTDVFARQRHCYVLHCSPSP